MPTTLCTAESNLASCSAKSRRRAPAPCPSGSALRAIICITEPPPAPSQISLRTSPSLAMRAVYKAARSLPVPRCAGPPSTSVSATKASESADRRRCIIVARLARRFSATATSSKRSSCGRSSSSASLTRNGRLTTCWLRIRRHSPDSGYVCKSRWSIWPKSPASASAKWNATGGTRYWRDSASSMSKWKDTVSAKRCLVDGTSRIITSSRQRPCEPSTALPHLSKCSTRD
mmetsp:Transcript_36258/g.100656  ORF Transcript_36258/g.100656 Transcript_36258/m.100656 type:complete len:231 (+) Transcript_36258:991-1683(+)